MSAHLVVNDTRTGVVLVKNRERLVVVLAQCYQIDRSLQPFELERRLRVRIHRGQRGCPILITKRGSRSSFLFGRTIRQFERENQVSFQPVDSGTLESLAVSEFGRPWAQLLPKERLSTLEWLAEVHSFLGKGEK